MASVRHYIQRIKEGRLKQIMGEVLWMYAYVRRYWLLIGVYILLGASGSVLGLGTLGGQQGPGGPPSPGVNSMEIVRVAGTYVGVGVSQIFINAVKSPAVPEGAAESHQRDPGGHLRAGASDPTGSPWPSTAPATFSTGSTGMRAWWPIPS